MATTGIFNAVAMASAQIIKEEKLANKAKQIADVQRKVCGNCEHWMKTTCIPEKKHGKLKSCNSLGCEAWVWGFRSKYILSELTKEFETLRAE